MPDVRLLLAAAPYALMAATPTAAAGQDAPRFAPPEGVPLRYETVDERDLGTATLRLRTLRELRFDRADDGWIAQVRLVDLGSEGPESLTRMLAAPQRIMQGVAVGWRLDAAGRPVAPVDSGTGWQQFEAALAGLRGDLESEPLGLDRTLLAGLIARLEGLDPAGRAALQWGELSPLLPLAGEGGPWRTDADGIWRRSAPGDTNATQLVGRDGLLAESRREDMIRVGAVTRIHRMVIRRLP